jgi:hypothetical protein
MRLSSKGTPDEGKREADLLAPAAREFERGNFQPWHLTLQILL